MLGNLTNRWLTVLLALAGTSGVWSWEPAHGPLMTRWAKDVSPTRTLPDYPRPQLTRPDWINLNGTWDYAIRPKTDPTPATWDGDILVPFPVESALSGVMKPVSPDQHLWYRRTFRAPKLARGQRLLLHFGAVDWQCTVHVNGRRVGEHSGGYDPFSFDITSALQGGDNILTVAVWDPTDTGPQPRGKQVLKPEGIMYTAVSGIWQTVWLEPVPERHVESLRITPDINRGSVAVTVRAPAGSKVRLRARDGRRSVAAAEGHAGEPVTLTIRNPQLWSPDRPHLYNLEVRLLDGSTTVDRVQSYFGMRAIEVRPDAQGVNRLFLNHQPLFQYGPLDQGWWPDGLYTAPTDAALKYDIEMTKAFGMNLARKHVKYEPARWYYWCDKLGLLVWQDMPAGDTGRTPESKAQFRRELQAMIDTLHNHPSIVMWVPFNEGWGQHDTADVVRWIEHYDPSRPVNEASGWTDQGSGTVSDMHNYPGPGMRPVEPKRVSVLGEFGGLGMPVRGHSWQNERNWGYVSYQTKEELTEAYVGLLTAMRPLIGDGLSAAVYTQTTDVEIEVNGLMTYDRALVKMDLDRIAAAARRLHLPPPRLEPLAPTSQQTGHTWSYTLSKPADSWAQPDFAANDWLSGPGGFGTVGTPGAVVGTTWNSSDIWMRRTFHLRTLPQPGDLCLMVHHDEDAEIYLNGTLVRSFKGHVGAYSPVPLGTQARRALKPGENTLAVHCRQTTGGQFIDVGLVMMVEK